MTADLRVTDLHPGAAAWSIAETNGVITETIAKQALVYAAERTAADPEWLTDDRWVTVLMRLIHCAVPKADCRRRFDALVAAVPFGPQVKVALQGLVRP